MAPLETLWPNELHVLPRMTAWAAMSLCRHRPLTSKVAIICARFQQKNGRDVETLDDLSDAAFDFGIRVEVLLTPNVAGNRLP